MIRKSYIITLVIWISAQAVAWFYGGKEAAGWTALFVGAFSPAIVVFAELGEDL